MMERARAENEQGQLWLNIASSAEVLPGYLNLDNSIYFRLEPLLPIVRHLFSSERVRVIDRFRRARERAPVLIHDCRKRLPFDEESVDHIVCSHFLEHIYPDEATRVLADFRQVLRLGGTVHIIVPDLAAMVQDYVAGSRDADALIRATILSSPRRPTRRFRVLEVLGYEGLRHRWMYDRQSISRRVVDAGFELIDVSGVPSRCVRAEDGIESVHVSARKSAGRSERG